MKSFPLTLVAILFSLLSFSQSWTELSSYPGNANGRNHPVTFALNGYGYVVTGNYISDQLDEVLKYDPVNDSWSVLPPFPGGERGYAYGVTTGNKAYMGFGYSFEFQTGQTYWDDFWEFEPNTETWTQLTSCPCTPRTHPAMVATDTKIYVGLGGAEGGIDLKDWWEYDIATDVWTQKTDFPSTERHHPYYFEIDNIPYVGFGHHGANIFNDFYKYDPATDSWTTLGLLPAQGRVAGTQFSLNGKGYILSGQGETHDNLPTGEFWEYDPQTDTWTDLLPHPGTGRWAPGTFIIDGLVYMTGGETILDERDLWVFDFSPALSVETESNSMPVTMSPNPSTGHFSILSNNQFERIEVYNLQGQRIYNNTLKTDHVDLSVLGSGLYIVYLYQEDLHYVNKIQIRE